MGSLAQRGLRGRRYLSWVLFVAAFAVLVTACGIAPYASQTITGTGTQGTVSDLWRNDDSYYAASASCTGSVGGVHDGLVWRLQRRKFDHSDLSLSYTGKIAGAALPVRFGMELAHVELVPRRPRST